MKTVKYDTYSNAIRKQHGRSLRQGTGGFGANVAYYIYKGNGIMMRINYKYPSVAGHAGHDRSLVTGPPLFSIWRQLQ